MAKRKTGRPELPEGEAKDNMVAARLTDDEHAHVLAAAAKAGMTLSDYLRLRLFDETFVNAWTYWEAGGTVRVQTPINLPLPLWKRLKAYVDVLEPPAKETP